MKTDEEIKTAIAQAHLDEAYLVTSLQKLGLEAVILSYGFRKSLSNIKDYQHDVDLIVEGQLCQYKKRPISFSQIRNKYWGPFVDEVVKADRTPVNWYILEFSDTTVVAGYNPGNWKVQRSFDQADRSTKEYYVAHSSDCWLFTQWLEVMKNRAEDRRHEDEP